MIKKSDLIITISIAIVLVLGGIFLVYSSQNILDTDSEHDIGTIIDKFLLDAKEEINYKRKNQIIKIKEITVLSEKMSISSVKALSSLGWALICFGSVQLSVTYSLYRARKKELSKINEEKT